MPAFGFIFKKNLCVRFRALIGGLSSAGVVSDTLFRERLELDLLEACGLLKSATNFKKSVTRANTKLKCVPVCACARDTPNVYHR